MPVYPLPRQVAILGACSLLSVLMSCGSTSTTAVGSLDLTQATLRPADTVKSVAYDDLPSKPRSELLSYWRTQPALKASAVTPATNIVSVQAMSGAFRVISTDTATGTTQELFRSSARIQSVAATGDARLVAISALNPSTNTYDVYRVQPVQGIVERLTTNTKDDLNVSITADGETIVWEAVQQNYVSGGGASKVMFRDWGTGSGVEYVLNTTRNLRYPHITPDGGVISLTEKRSDQSYTSVVSYYTAGGFFYEVDRSTVPISHPSVSDGGHDAAWIETANDASVLKINDVDTGALSTRTFASASGVLEHANINASGDRVVVAEQTPSGAQASVLHLTTGAVTPLGDPAAFNAGPAWQAGAGTPAPTGQVLREQAFTLTADQELNAVMPVSAGEVALTAPAQISSAQLKLQELTRQLPATFPQDNIVSAVPHQVVGRYKLLSSQEGLADGLQVAMPFTNPDTTRYDLVHVFAWDGQTYRRLGGASPQGGVVTLSEFSTALSDVQFAQGLDLVAVGMNLAEFRSACTNRGGLFDGTSCDTSGQLVPASVAPQGVSDNKLTVLSINVGNTNCIGRDKVYLVKLCTFDDEISVKRFLKQKNADLVLLQEVFNDDCRFADGTTDDAVSVSGRTAPSVRVRTGRVCDQLERQSRTLGSAKQIERILPQGVYTYRCAPAKPLSGRLYSGYECIALKQNFLSFADPSTNNWLGELTADCAVANTQSLNTQLLTPQAIGGPPGRDTGSFYSRVVASGYSKSFYALTAHLAAPNLDECRKLQLDAFANWQRSTAGRFIFGGDFNTDPNYNLALTNAGIPTPADNIDDGQSAFNTIFIGDQQSANLGYDPARLGTALGFTMDYTLQDTAFYPFKTLSKVRYSLDHVLSNFVTPFFNNYPNTCMREKVAGNFDHSTTLCSFNISALR